MTRGQVRRSLAAALSLGLVAALSASAEWTQLRATLAAADKALVGAAFLVIGCIPLVAAERWRMASLAAGVRLTHGFFLSATYAAAFAGQFLPSGLGTDAVRLALLWRRGVPLREAFQAVAVDRACGVGALLALVYAGLPFALDLLPRGAAGPIAAAATAVLVACAAALFVDRWPLPRALRGRWLGRLLTFVTEVRAAIATPRTAVAAALSVVLHVLAVAAILVLARAFGYDLRFRDLVTVSAVAVFAGMLPVSFNGWGVREGALMLGLSLLAVPRDAALMIALLFGAAGAAAALPGSVTWLRAGRLPDPGEGGVV